MFKRTKQESLEGRNCPGCGKTDGLRYVLYGLPDDTVDFNDVVLGGCCVYPDMPTIGCLHCEWTGEVRQLVRE